MSRRSTRTNGRPPVDEMTGKLHAKLAALIKEREQLPMIFQQELNMRMGGLTQTIEALSELLGIPVPTLGPSVERPQETQETQNEQAQDEQSGEAERVDGAG